MKQCRHCECDISGKAECETCQRVLVDQCATCHNELSHDVIVNQNIHFVGSGSGGSLNSIDADPDAFGRADQ